MVVFKRTDDGWVDRALASLSPADAQHRLRLGARAFGEADLLDATANAVVRMDAGLRAELARSIGMTAAPIALGEMFFEPPLDLEEGALRDAVRNSGDAARIGEFLARNPRATAAYGTVAASRLLGSGPPPRRSPLPLALAAGLSVFAAGALIALGSLVIPKADDIPSVAAPAVVGAAPAAAAAAPARRQAAPFTTRRPPTRGPQLHRPQAHRQPIAPPAAAPSATEPPSPAFYGPRIVAAPVVTRPSHRQTPERPRRHPLPRPHTDQVAASGNDRQSPRNPAVLDPTPQPHMTFWRRIYNWVRIRKPPNS